jgi:hypothetical protein
MDFWAASAPMLVSNRERRAVTTRVFGVTVGILLIIAAIAFVLYGTRSTMQETSTVTITDTMTRSASPSGSMNETAAPAAIAFAPAHGQMFGGGWLIVAALGNADYALTLHATGLEPGSMGDYIVEAAQNSGQMATVPVAGTNATLSEFEADSSGNGQFFTVLMENPNSTYESVSIVYLPGMEMTNATVVATATLT